MLLELEQLQAEWLFELIKVDIDSDSALREKYNTRIPLLEDHSGRCISEYFLDQVTLLSYLQDA
jgi:glutathione S-transferase